MLAKVKMHKAEKYALRNTPEVSLTFFLKNFGCSRKVYNLYTDHLYTKLDESGYESGDLPDIKLPEVTTFKKAYPYMREVDSLALSNAKIDFESAVNRFKKEYDHTSYTKRAKRRAESGTEPLTFRGLKGMPKFHSKARGDFSYRTNCQYPDETNNLKQPTIRIENGMLHLPKLPKDVELVIHRPLPEDAVIGNVTITMEAGKLYASVEYSYETEMDITLREAALNNDASVIDKLSFIGLDYSQPDFYVDSEGRKANAPHTYKKSEEKMARLQRELSRMQKGSNNYKKKQAEIRKVHTKIKNQRKDFVRKEAAYLASTYDVVVVEDINLRAMGGALSLGKNLHDNGFGMFRDILARLLEQKGSVLVKVDRFFPSTKTCSVCGAVNREVTLGVQEWDCPVCGAHHLRDDNAAVNIREEGKRILLEYFRQWLDEDQKARNRAKARSDGRKNKKDNGRINESAAVNHTNNRQGRRG